jgi:superfamily II DNA or RNA helicase
MLKELEFPKNRLYKSSSSYEPFKFYLDCLLNSNRLDLLLGYFSSSAINVLAIGFASFIHRGGMVRLIINDILFQKDKEAILKGEKGFIEEDLIDIENYENLKNTLSNTDQFFFDCLAYLIKKGRLQFVIIRPKNKQGISHFKSGVFSDGTSSIGFKATCNFTATALISNLEELTVIDPKDGEIQKSQLEEQVQYFESTYSGKNDTVEYLSMEKVKQAIKSLSNDKEVDELLIDEEELIDQKKRTNTYLTEELISKVKEDIEKYHASPKFPYINGPRDYQIEAYEKWLENGKKGLFAMATGTGKTLTSLNCLLEEYNNSGTYRALILVPTITLVNQWEEEVAKFNFKRVLKISSKSNWKTQLSTLLANAKRNDSSFIIISTYATFTTKIFKNYINRLPNDTLLIADEAHNIGARTIRERLRDVELAKRIGLSATPKRAYDEEGTAAMVEFFNDQEPYTFSYSMSKAITNNILCRYNYFPHIVHLTTEELEEYIKITKQLSKFFYDGEMKRESKTILETLLLKRKRIIHKASNKLSTTISILKDHLSEKGDLKYSFIYVPEGKSASVSEYSLEDNDENRIINQYTAAIGGIDDTIFVNKFVSGLSNRDEILNQFRRGDIHVLASMKCLDEGVDVPRAEFAIFCSSTGNPRQYIQRRGRILRQHPEKSLAIVHDLVVVPIIENTDEATFETEKKLVKSELERVMYFASLSQNLYHSVDIFNEVCNHYSLNLHTIYNELKNE